MSQSSLTTSLNEGIQIIQKINLPEYIVNHQDKLKPPVSNILMFNGSHLKIMLVKGPNKRDDYHLNQGYSYF